MDAAKAADNFYDALPVFDDFTRIVDEALFAPLPDGWVVGVADVVQSTKAIAENRYKAVNMAGAAVIVSITNALKGRDFPFVFGGDGASFAVSPEDAELARQALAETATWVREDLDLALRIGMTTVAAIRAQGHDVRVARYAPSPNISIAMFSGGGLAFADAAMKRGDIALAEAPPGAHPDLSGLSCRYELIPAQRGLVLSLVVTPGERADPETFRAAIKAITDIVEKTPDASRPIPGKGLRLKWPPSGADLEARALAPDRRIGSAAQDQGAGTDLPDFSRFALQTAARGVRRRPLRARTHRQFRFPQVRRQLAHGARLHARACRRYRDVSEGGISRRHRPLRRPPAGGGHDDLLCPAPGQSEPRALHRRRRWRLCDGGDDDEGRSIAHGAGTKVTCTNSEASLSLRGVLAPAASGGTVMRTASRASHSICGNLARSAGAAQGAT